MSFNLIEIFINRQDNSLNIKVDNQVWSSKDNQVKELNNE